MDLVKWKVAFGTFRSSFIAQNYWTGSRRNISVQRNGSATQACWKKEKKKIALIPHPNHSQTFACHCKQKQFTNFFEQQMLQGMPELQEEMEILKYSNPIIFFSRDIFGVNS